MTAATFTPAERKVSLPTKLAYGFGSIAYGVKDNGFSTLLLLFYNQVVGLPAGLVGVAVMIALVLDAVIDPVVGHLSDHLRTPWGRRHPFMYASAVPVGLLYLLLWRPPAGASQGLLLVYLAVIAILVRTAISCYEVPSSALAPELTVDYHERTSVLGWRYIFGWLGGMGMLLVTFNVFLHPTARYPVGQLNPEGYRHYAIAAALLMTAAILTSASGTHREIARLPRPPIKRTDLAGTFRGILGTLKRRPFVILLVSGVFSYTNQGLLFALSTYFNTFLWGFPASVLAIFTVAVLAGVGLAFLFAGWTSRIWGKRKAAVGCVLVYVVTAATPLTLRLIGRFPENGSPALLPILMTTTMFSTMLGVASAILSASMMADVVEDAQAETGERSEGLFFAGSFFMQKCVSGLGLFLSGAILSAVHFPTGAVPGHVPTPVLHHLIMVYVSLSATLSLISAAVLARFPLGEADHRRRLETLAEAAAHVTLPGGEPEFPADELAGPEIAGKAV